MRMFIPSVLLALKALLKLPRWFLWKVLKIFIGGEKPRPPSNSYSPYSPHDSNGIPSQRTLLFTHRQTPQSRPADGDHTPPSQSPHYQTPPQSYRRRHLPNQNPTGATPLVPSNISSPSIITAPPAIGDEDHVSLGLGTRHEISGPEDYESLRANARQEGDEMAKSFQQSHEAYARREHALAKELSEEGRQHERTMDALNAVASAWIFRENNLDSKPGELDLHGLYAKEAISYSDKAIKEARQRGDSQIRLIVGKGLHSEGNIAILKPALEKWTSQHNLSAEVDPQNEGVLVVQLA